jgi:hypothetical protein
VRVRHLALRRLLARLLRQQLARHALRLLDLLLRALLHLPVVAGACGALQRPQQGRLRLVPVLDAQLRRQNTSQKSEHVPWKLNAQLLHVPINPVLI